MKVQKCFQNGSNSIIEGVMINFWFFEIQKSDLLVYIWWTLEKYTRKGSLNRGFKPTADLGEPQKF